ncbi:MAG TPA: FtsX-like permease family protein, partial [Mycobacteriales bacterium]|nr:FtsX-like permease family protein [Mycobacteriales bacterium]
MAAESRHRGYDEDDLLDDRTHWWRLLTSPPWRRAPLLLRGQPGVLLALAAAAAILGVAGASAPLFLASAGTAELASTVRAACPEDSAVTVTSGPTTDATGSPVGLTSADPDNLDEVTVDTAGQDRTVRAALRRVGLPAPYRVVIAAARLGLPGAALKQDVILYARVGVRDHLRAVRRSGGDGRGIWLPASAAGTLGARIGGTATVNGAPVPVAGLFRDIDSGGRVPRYWCTWSALVQPSASRNSSPLFVPVDPATMRRLPVHRVGEWFCPPDVGRLTVRSAHDSLRHAAALPSALAASAEGADSFGLSVRATGLDADVSRAELASRGLRGPIQPVAVTGALVALLLVGASGGYWAERRATEVRLLAARGVSPAALGVKAVLETAPAVLVGLVAGWAAALALVRWLGPSPLLEQGAPGRAAVTVGEIGAFGLVMLGTVTGLRAWTAVSRRRRRLRGLAWRRTRLWRVLPWELTLVALAALFYRQARAQGVVTDHFLVQVPPRLVAFPLVGLAGYLLFAARLAARPMPALRRITSATPAPVYLASRRVTAAPAVFLTLLVATAMPVGLLGYAATLSRSTDATVHRKAEVNLGAPSVVTTTAAGGRPVGTGGQGTQVSVVTDASVDGDNQSMVLGIDPATFGRYALDVADRPLADLLAPLRVAGTAVGAVPAILVNPIDRTPVRDAEFDGVRVGVRVVATVSTFPGLRSGTHPMLVMPRDSLRVGPYTRRAEEVWTTPAGLPAV